MEAPDYLEPRTVGEAIALLERFGGDAHLIAGGTALMLLLKEGLIRPARLIALRRIEELRGVRRDQLGGLEIRALTTHREAETSPDVLAHCPALASAFGAVATIRIRNQATVGGNVVHADPAQDPPPMLIALDATVVLRGPRGDRTVPLEQFFVDYYETTIASEEVLIAIRVPPLSPWARTAYVKYLPASQNDYATAAVAVRLEMGPDGVCRDVRIGLGGAAPTPVRATDVENALRGEHLTADRVRDAAALVAGQIDPLDDARGSAWYKGAMVRVWVERAITGLLGSGPATGSAKRRPS